MGCAVVSKTGHRPSPPAATPQPILPHEYRDYVGVMHIHTVYSDGAGTFEEIARIANSQRLDYLVVTDHNTLKPLRDGKQGWHGMTLVLVGTEISTRDGHYLALNVTEEIDRNKLDTQRIIDEVNRQGGLGFIAHPYFKKRRWTDWSVHGMVGIEAYNAAHDTLDENRLRLVMWTFGVPVEPFYASILDRPYDPLSKWDEMIARHGRLTGIGASDAHEVRVLGLKIAPYEIMFRLIRTHVLIPSETLTDRGVYEALRQGHVYLSIELFAEAKGFSFSAQQGDRVVGIMGDEIPWQPDLYLAVSLPAPAQLTLLRDGHPVASMTGQRWTLPVAQPGTYRVEAMRHTKPWIFSNPIYVRPAATIVDSPKP
ncbi:MAG: CehA/McbA family metallohydrolase [Candidatus Omnitrophica bacterium]|nr:CehA/McbA family metallohydrolase [Candidatus Omnitrophota bacterium]